MSIATAGSSPDLASASWATRNQAWLSRRIAHWQEVLERGVTRSDSRVERPLEDELEDFTPAAMALGTLFGLSSFEKELLVLAAGVEIDRGLGDAVARAQAQGAGEQGVHVSFSLALELLSEAHWDALSPLRPLRHWSLVHVDTTDGLARSRLRIDERVLHYLTGVVAFDPQLSDLAWFDDGPLDPAVNELACRIASAAQMDVEAGAPLIMLADALEDSSRKRTARSIARAVFRQLDLRTLWVDVGWPFGEGVNIGDNARRLDREAALGNAGVALALDTQSGQPQIGTRLVRALQSPVLVLGAFSPSELVDLPARRPVRFSVPPAGRQRVTASRPAVQPAIDRALQQFRVDSTLVEQALATIAEQDDEHVAAERLWQTLRESARGGLDALAQRIESHATLADLVVPSHLTTQLQEIAAQLRHRHTVYEEWGFAARGRRGLGLAALFAGESGTGKTLAAEAIANEVRLDLYRIDLASVVSKFIGETEKNLARLFDAAERSGAVLLFDEAEALFGKRSEVRDSHDRYANIDIAYLLQRVETYRGLAILTTNMKSALDRSFLRRIRFVVQFPFPNETAREQIWRLQLPRDTPLGIIDYAALARLQLSGGHIRNVALNAAFHAAGRDGSIEQGDLVVAARAELAKLERPFSPSHGAGR